MSRLVRIASGTVVMMVPAMVFAEFTIPKGQLDPHKIYWGISETFEKPAELRFKDVIRSTPEYQELRKRNVARGTGKYWLLMSQASDRVVRTIDYYGHDTEYDIVAETGYLSSLEAPIPADEVTEVVIKFMNRSERKPGKEGTALERLGAAGVKTIDKTLGTTLDTVSPVLPTDALPNVTDIPGKIPARLPNVAGGRRDASEQAEEPAEPAQTEQEAPPEQPAPEGQPEQPAPDAQPEQQAQPGQ